MTDTPSADTVSIDAPSTDTASIADRYRRLASRFTDVVDAVPDTRWESPSPCAGWTARDVVAHVVATERDFLAGMPFGDDPAGDDPDDDPGDPDADFNPLAAWPLVRDRVQAALDDPTTAGHTYDGFFGPITFAETIGMFYCFDLVVHAWDLARAAALAEHEVIDPADIEWARDTMAPLGDNVRTDGVLGPEIIAADDASDQDRFLAWTGRQP